MSFDDVRYVRRADGSSIRVEFGPQFAFELPRRVINALCAGMRALHYCTDPDCEGSCPNCGACLHNNGACGDPECCGENFTYCTREDCSY